MPYPEPAASNSFFDDETFQDHLVALLCQDIKILRECAALLSPDDFKPLRGMRWGRPRWVVGERALEYFQRYREPIGQLLQADVLEHAANIGMGGRQITELREYLQHLSSLPPVPPAALSEKVLRYKRGRIKASVIQELTDLQSSGQLTDEKWYELSQRAVASFNGGQQAIDYLAGLEARLERRQRLHRYSHVPVTFIDPLDSLVQVIGPKQLGLILAPYKRGKSLMLLWLAVAYVLQRRNVMYFTLEDPRSDVEDRLDAILTNIPIHSLGEYPQAVKRRYERKRRMCTAQLLIHDATEGGISVPQIDQAVEEARNRGFHTDAIIIDYDDEIVPAIKQKERRFEFADIYRDLRRLAATNNAIVWTAAQTQRDTENLKVIGGDRAAEDISKLRKATMAIGMGKGDWGPDSIYLWIAAHKFDAQHLGCHIVPDLSRMLIYDREATRRAMQHHAAATP